MSIEQAKVDKLKCFQYECDVEIPSEKIKEILTTRDMKELYEKYERFKK